MLEFAVSFGAFMMKITLETDRLIIRNPLPDDAHAVADALNNPDLAATMLMLPFPYTVEEAATFITENSDPGLSGDHIRLLVFLKDTGQLAGGISLDEISPENRSAELGYWTAHEFWGQGIATEAAREMIRYGFVEMGLNRISGRCVVKNYSSERVLQKIGMKQEGVARWERIFKGEPVDVTRYALTKSDWDAGSLEKRPLRFETERLILRTPHYDDIERIIEPINDPEIHQFSARVPYPFTIEDAREWYAHQSMAETQWDNVYFLMFLKDTDEIVGSVWLRTDLEHHKGGIAYWVARKHWGKGYATEAAREIMRYGFTELGIRRIGASIIMGNEASVRVCTKLGMTFECTSMQEWWHGETPLHCHHYVLMKSDWENPLA